MSRKPWFWILLILGLLMVAGLVRLRFDVDVLNLLPKDLPVVRGLELYQRHFTDSRELLVTIQSADAAKTEAVAGQMAKALREQTNLVASVMWQPAWLEHPAQAAELMAYLWLNQPPAVFGESAGHLTGTNIAATLADAREQLATSLSPQDFARGYDPYNLMNLPESVSSGASSLFGGGQGMFASADGTFRIVIVKARGSLSNYQDCIAWMRNIKSAVAEMQRSGVISGDAAIGFTGGPAFTAEISSGMQHDMTSSIGITSVIIAILFWIFHRRWIPMLWLLVLLGLILACTLALGGLFFGTVNVVSLGFAGILLGLAVDYGVVHYQEAMAAPNAIIPEIRRAIGPSIFWAAFTTISAFLVLNFGGLPGLAQLGSLVALGVALSALVMLFAFLPPLFRDRIKKRSEQIAAGNDPVSEARTEMPDAIGQTKSRLVFGATALLIVVAALVLRSGAPALDHSADALRPRNSAAYTALDAIRAKLAQNHEPLWLIAQGRDEMEVARHFDAVRPFLEQAISNHIIGSFTGPALWPRPDYQAANRETAARLVAERATLHSAALEQGFSTNALLMTDNMLNVWQRALATPGVFWPTNEMSEWILEKVAARAPDGYYAAAFIFPNTNSPPTLATLSGLSQDLIQHGFILSGWNLLGSAILARVEQNMWKVLLPMVALVLFSLWLAFRRPTEILLSLAVLCLSGLVLLTVMRLAGWSWNLLNLMALPLMLGSGVDYSIFMQLALRRHHGNLAGAHHSVGRALLLCGGTAVAGFGSLSWSTNAGMAGLGEVCAIGIAGNMLISVFLLPVWWRRVAGKQIENEKLKIKDSETPAATAPSSLYRSELWRLGLAITRRLSPETCARISRTLAGVYWTFARSRREVVIENLLPPLGDDRAAAEKKAGRWYSNLR